MITLDYTFERQITLEHEEGRKEKQIELVRNMLSYGMSKEEISRACKLPIEDVEQIAKAAQE